MGHGGALQDDTSDTYMDSTSDAVSDSEDDIIISDFCSSDLSEAITSLRTGSWRGKRWANARRLLPPEPVRRLSHHENLLLL